MPLDDAATCLAAPEGQHQQQHGLLPAAAIAALVLAVLFLASWLTNRRFGHPTYHRPTRAPVDDERRRHGAAAAAAAAPSWRASSSPPAHAAAAPTGPPLLQERLPPELLVDQVLPFLTPFEIITGPALCSRACWAAAEAPELWARLARRAGLLALVDGVEQRSVVEEEGEDEDDDDNGASSSEGDGAATDASPNTATHRAGTTAIKSKLEFFRRSFLLPYALTKGHGSPSSCRVVIHGAAYDVTGYLADHPGGDAIILEYSGGLDASTVFELALHSARARRKMGQFLLWDPASPACLGRRGTILGLFRAAATGGRGLGSTAAASNNGSTVASLTSLSSSSTSPPPGATGGILRANDARSPPTIVHALEAVEFGPP